MSQDHDVHLGAIVAGDADAFGRWMAAAEPPMRANLRSFAAVVDVEAVLQESLLRVWQKAPSLTPDGRPNCLLRYAFRVSRNLAIAEARRRRPSWPISDHIDSPEARSHDPGLRAALLLCLNALPDKPREAMLARLRSGGIGDEHVARTVSMSLNAFYQNIRRARDAIARCLSSKGFDMGRLL